jgi:hypothetical protein
MGYIRCNRCGRVVNTITYREVGLKCGVFNCDGIMEFVGGYYVYPDKGAKLDLKCRTCGSVCSSAVTGLKIGSTCPITGCYGSLDRNWG